MLVCVLCCSLPDCFCSNASESSSCFGWKSSSSVDTELVCLSRAASCPNAHATNKHTSLKSQAVLPNSGSDLGCQLGLAFFSKEGCRRIQAEKDGQRSLVGQSESLRRRLAHHICSEVNELAVNFKLVGKKTKNPPKNSLYYKNVNKKDRKGLWVMGYTRCIGGSLIKSSSRPKALHLHHISLLCIGGEQRRHQLLQKTQHLLPGPC